MAYSLQVLGCGASTGVPVPGCLCAVCQSTDPRNSRFRTSARLIVPDGRSILIDASADLRTIALRYQIRSVDAVLFTHAHADHILGIDDLRSFNFAQKAAIPCFGSRHTLQRIESFFDYIFDPDPNYKGGGLARLTSTELQWGVAVEICGVRVTPVELLHGDTPVTGFRFGNVAWAPDCNAIPAHSRELLRNLDVLFLNALRYEPHATHFSFAESIDVARELAPRQCYFIHMTHAIDYETSMATLPSGVALATDGLTVPIRFDHA